jgi:hypothetical protein
MTQYKRYKAYGNYGCRSWRIDHPSCSSKQFKINPNQILKACKFVVTGRVYVVEHKTVSKIISMVAACIEPGSSTPARKGGGSSWTNPIGQNY